MRVAVQHARAACYIFVLVLIVISCSMLYICLILFRISSSMRVAVQHARPVCYVSVY